MLSAILNGRDIAGSDVHLMLKKCDVILADEPTGSLDEENADMVMNILHLLNQTGKTVVLVTHSEKIIKSESRVIKL